MSGRTLCRQQVVACLLFILSLCSPELLADEFRPALLEITEREGGWVDVTWKVPMLGGRVAELTPILPDFLEPVGTGAGRRVPGAWLEYNTFSSGGESLTGVTVGVDGLDAVPADVVVRISLVDGAQHSAILRADKNSFTIPEQATRTELAISYWRMGTIHILEGYDHLLFLLALLLIVTGLWPLLKTITAFTVAHSLTLALATLGLVHIPPAPTEAVISLSIVLLAVEVVRKNAGELTLSERYPWLVAFSFGLVHGLGFAGALSEIGVPQNDVPLALLMFNVGVETGQLLFVAAVLVVIAAVRRLPVRWPQGSWRLMPYAIGSIAAFWTVQRIDSFF